MRRRHLYAGVAGLVGALLALSIGGGAGYSLDLLWYPIGFVVCVYVLPLIVWVLVPDAMFVAWFAQKAKRGRKK